MNMKEIKTKAKNMGINPLKMNKTELIRAIQRTEGNNQCYKTGIMSCDQTNCCWRKDCLGK